MEQDLQVFRTGKTNKAGEEILNLNLKTRVNKSTGEVNAGLTVDNYVVVEKVFAEGYENKKPSYSFFACKVKYKDEEMSFLLNEKEHEDYKSCGGIGDKVKVTLVSYEYTYQNDKKTATKLVFDLVE